MDDQYVLKKLGVWLMDSILLSEESLRAIRPIVEEIERLHMVGMAMQERLMKVVFIETGIDTNAEPWELDVQRGVMRREKSKESSEAAHGTDEQ